MVKYFGCYWYLKVCNIKQVLDLIEVNKSGFKVWMKCNIKIYDCYYIQIINKQGYKWFVDESEYQMMGQFDNIVKICIIFVL